MARNWLYLLLVVDCGVWSVDSLASPFNVNRFICNAVNGTRSDPPAPGSAGIHRSTKGTHFMFNYLIRHFTRAHGRSYLNKIK